MRILKHSIEADGDPKVLLDNNRHPRTCTIKLAARNGARVFDQKDCVEITGGEYIGEYHTVQLSVTEVLDLHKEVILGIASGRLRI